MDQIKKLESGLPVQKTSGAKTRESVSPEKKSASEETQRSAKVSISPLAGAKAGAEPPVDTAKVEALRQKIERGEYRPNPEAIARKMLEQDTATLRAVMGKIAK